MLDEFTRECNSRVQNIIIYNMSRVEDKKDSE